MKAADLVAWSEALGVPVQEVHTALRFREKQVTGLRDDVVKAWSGLRDAPDEELVLHLGVAGRVLQDVAEELGKVSAEARREVG